MSNLDCARRIIKYDGEKYYVNYEDYDVHSPTDRIKIDNIIHSFTGLDTIYVDYYGEWYIWHWYENGKDSMYLFNTYSF